MRSCWLSKPRLDVVLYSVPVFYIWLESSASLQNKEETAPLATYLVGPDHISFVLLSQQLIRIHSCWKELQTDEDHSQCEREGAEPTEKVLAEYVR